MRRLGAEADYPQLSTVRVLVVDDVDEIREVLVEILERHGAMVLTAGTAEEALELLQEWRPDVLVSDLGIRGKDGYWLIAQVRALPVERGGETPAAALTTLSGPEDRARVLRAGFQYHLSKPVDLRILAGVVAILALKR